MPLPLPALAFALLLGAWAVPARAVEMLTEVAQIRRLSVAEAATEQRCEVEAVVTFRQGGLAKIVQQGASGIWLEGLPVSAELGERWRWRGHTNAGQFAPMIVVESAERLGRGELPAPRSATETAFFAGTLDCQRVELQGIVRSVDFDLPFTRCILAFGSNRIMLAINGRHRHLVEKLVDAEVHAVGVSGHAFNAGRQIRYPLIRVDGPEDVVVVVPPPAPRELPVTPIDELLLFRAETGWLHRVRVRGMVTGAQPGEWIHVQQGDRGLRLWTPQTAPVAPGDQVEAYGFPEPGAVNPELYDARFKRQGRGPEITPARAPSLNKPEAVDGQLLRVEARLTARRDWTHYSTLALETVGEPRRAFEARLESPWPASWRRVEPGARLDVTGICLVAKAAAQSGPANSVPKKFEFLLRRAEDVRVLQAAPWWNAARLTVALGALGLASLFGAGWTVTVLRKNRALAAAEGELRLARDALADRVESRTGQLQEQMSARHEQQAVFTAVNEERNRVARELHDSVQQHFAGAALRLEALARRASDGSRTELTELVAAMRDGQDDVRRSVHNLRALALERHPLGEALQETVAILLDGTSVAVEGAARPLGLEAENHVLRIVQEAVANTLKHAVASALRVSLRYGADGLQVSIEDDGRGFIPPADGAGRAAHFGLRGIHERARLLGGRSTIASAPECGTTVVLHVPLAPSVAAPKQLALAAR